LFHLCICALRSFDNHVGFAPCTTSHHQELYEQDYLLGTGRSGSNELWSEWSLPWPIDKHLLLMVQCFFCIEYLLALASALKFSMLT